MDDKNAAPEQGLDALRAMIDKLAAEKAAGVAREASQLRSLCMAILLEGRNHFRFSDSSRAAALALGLTKEADQADLIFAGDQCRRGADLLTCTEVLKTGVNVIDQEHRREWIPLADWAALVKTAPVVRRAIPPAAEAGYKVPQGTRQKSPPPPPVAKPVESVPTSDSPAVATTPIFATFNDWRHHPRFGVTVALFETGNSMAVSAWTDFAGPSTEAKPRYVTQKSWKKRPVANQPKLTSEHLAFLRDLLALRRHRPMVSASPQQRWDEAYGALRLEARTDQTVRVILPALGLPYYMSPKRWDAKPVVTGNQPDTTPLVARLRGELANCRVGEERIHPHTGLRVQLKALRDGHVLYSFLEGPRKNRRPIGVIQVYWLQWKHAAPVAEGGRRPESVPATPAPRTNGLAHLPTKEP